MGKFTIEEAKAFGKMGKGEVGFRNCGHATWILVYGDGSTSDFKVVALRDEIAMCGLKEVY